MLSKIKNFPINIPAILICLVLVFISSVFLIKASSGAKVQFTADTIVSLSGITDGDLYIANTSECDSLSVSGSTLTVNDIPAGSSFILKTSSHNNALKITPSGGVLDLTFVSGNLSSGNIIQWTLNASTGTTVAHIVGAPQANTWYAVKTDNVLFNTFQSSASGEVSFTYDGEFSSKVFTIEQDTTAPTEFSLISPINNATTSNSKPTFLWNASSDPDLSHYQLYIDSVLDTDNIANTSTIPTNNLSCGNHTWYVKAIDNAGNSTDSSTFNLTMACGSGMPPSFQNPPSQPEPTPENPNNNFSIVINNDDEYTNSKTVTLKLNAGSDTERMAISNTEDFKNASQIPYQKEIEWNLSDCKSSPNSSVCTVYAKFYTQYGVASEVVSDSIIYTNKSNPVIPNGSLIRSVNDYKVYIINNSYKRHILDGKIFDFYGHLNWDSIQEVDPSTINNYQESFLIRASNDYKVYEIDSDKTKHWLNITAEEFVNSGRKWEMIYVVNEEERDFYKEGEEIK